MYGRMVLVETSALTFLSPVEIAGSLAGRAKELRLLHRWTRATLAARAGVSSASLKRFETTGKASLELVLRVAHALGRLGEFETLLRPPAARSIAELEERTSRPAPKRGRI